MENRDKVIILLAGGRIVQHVDGSELTDEEAANLLPAELQEHTTFQKWSFQPVSNYTLRMCSEIIEMAAGFINNEGAAGVVVACGIQCLAELAYFADLVWDLNPPIIFTSSIFNIDSQNSETDLRLSQSVKAILSGACTGKGALICIRDEIFSPADVLEVSNFERAGILACPEVPLGIFIQPSGDYISLRQPRQRNVQKLNTPVARNIPILCSSLGESDILLKALADKRFEELDGLIVAGLGDGDLPSSWIPLLKKILRSDIPIVLTTKSPNCCVQPNEDFEGSASQMIEAGLINAGMLTPCQARIRLAVGLAAGLKGDDLAKYMHRR